jgi:hypothetical protein
MAGFEIRDSIGWVYGSGFPKSLDVSKAIDKVNGEGQRVQSFVRYMKTTQLKAKDIDEALKQAGLISLTSNRAIHYFNEGQPQIPTWEMWQVIRPMLGEVPFEIDLLVDRIEAEREVIGSKMSGIANKDEKERHTIGANKAIEVDITAPSTPEAKQWQGWGTALKPALEPIVVARKPLIGTVAENVLTHGTGGLNIDASRIGTTDNLNGGIYSNKKGKFGYDIYNDARSYLPKESYKQPAGRWPANLILDEYTAELLDEQSGQTASKAANRGLQVSGQAGGLAGSNPNYKDGTDSIRGHNDSGGASRFFYVAKASKRDRNEGLEDLEAQRHSDRELDDGAGGDNPRNRTNNAKQNFHPTVKPTELMRYLVKLITPPGGTVLDPFTGSGSTGKAAILEGFDFIGIELTEDYWPIIEGRLKHAEAKVAERIKETSDQEQEKLF